MASVIATNLLITARLPRVHVLLGAGFEDGAVEFIADREHALFLVDDLDLRVLQRHKRHFLF